MAHLVGDIAKYFKIEEIDIDNWVFKMFYQGCVLIFFTGSMVGVMSQYFGEPINCDFKGIDGEMASDYCWIHGSSYIPYEYQSHMKCIVDLDGVESADDAPDTSYYQWVTFVLLFQAGCFILPYKVWRLTEGGLMEAFGTEGKSAVMLSEESKYEDGVIMEQVLEKFVKYFRTTFHRNNWYFAKFVVCEFANVAMLYLNFWFTDQFLQGRFRYYGWDVIQYYRLSKGDQRVRVNPFCAAFPTEVSCTVPNIGAAGGGQMHNGLCVLSQNIINEKMYLVIWFWLVFLMVLSVPFVFCRLCTVFFDYVRFAVLVSRAGHTNDPDVRQAIKYVLDRGYAGDWFLLHQLSKNVNQYFFREFIKELRNDLRERPEATYGRGQGKRRPGKKVSRSPTVSSAKIMAPARLNHVPMTPPQQGGPGGPTAPPKPAPSRAAAAKDSDSLLSSDDHLDV